MKIYNLRKKRVFVFGLFWAMLPLCAISSEFFDGTGEPNDPYQVSTAEQLIHISEDPNLLDKHFKLVADIDLSGIPKSGPVIQEFNGTFDGNELSIQNILIEAPILPWYVGIFGTLGGEAEVRNLSIIDVNIIGAGYGIGALAGRNYGRITNCSSTGTVSGGNAAGGLTGDNYGSIAECYSSVTVSGKQDIGGLVGVNNGALVHSYSTGEVSGEQRVGGIVGINHVAIANCYSNCVVFGNQKIGGFVGENKYYGSLINCYCMGDISGEQKVGGFLGANSGSVSNCYSIGTVSGNDEVGGFSAFDEGSMSNCFWDKEASQQVTSEGAVGLSTNQMKNVATFVNKGWDFVDEVSNGTSEVWQMTTPNSYPQLSIFAGYEPLKPSGEGTFNAPYLITNIQEFGSIYHRPNAYYKFVTSIDLHDIGWSTSVIPIFYGVVDGNDLAVTNLKIHNNSGHIGIFGTTLYGARIENLGVDNVDIVSTGNLIGVLAAYNYYGVIVNCHSSGSVTGSEEVGGLIGENYRGRLDFCHSTATTSGTDKIGGLAGSNYGGILSQCYSNGTITGDTFCGGLVGTNYYGLVNECYSGSSVQGSTYVGGIVGSTTPGSRIINCYSTGTVDGGVASGGLLGANSGEVITSYSIGEVLGSGFSIGGLIGTGTVKTYSCFWDKITSGQTRSAGGIGMTTSQMKTASTYLNAGWDFAEETANGTEDIWWILGGQSYPMLWWELIPEN